MAARLFGLKFFAARPQDRRGTTAWSADEPLDIPLARDLLDFSYPPESAFSDHSAGEES